MKILVLSFIWTIFSTSAFPSFPITTQWDAREHGFTQPTPPSQAFTSSSSDKTEERPYLSSKEHGWKDVVPIAKATEYTFSRSAESPQFEKKREYEQFKNGCYLWTSPEGIQYRLNTAMSRSFDANFKYENLQRCANIDNKFSRPYYSPGTVSDIVWIK